MGINGRKHYEMYSLGVGLAVGGWAKSRNLAIPVCLFLIKLVFVWHRRRSELAWTTELNFGHQKSLSGENFLHVQRNMLESFSCTFKMWRQRAVSFSHTFELFWMSKT